MPDPVDLYDNAYARAEHDLYRDVRTETYGQDLGQTSWVTATESALIPSLLQLNSHSTLLELGCGSGHYALHLARTIGCHLTGLDLNAHAIASATQLASRDTAQIRASFLECDLSKPLPFGETAFDAAFANDVLCHVPNRAGLLQELFRILRSGARLLFSDALIIGGLVSHAEVATRSSIGPYFFSPPGENERLLDAAGFVVLSVTDTSDQAAEIARRWHDARERRRDRLIALEGPHRFEGLQHFLACVHSLTSEHRLLRHLYLAEKPLP